MMRESVSPATSGQIETVVRLEEAERREIVRALNATNGNAKEAAERLGIARPTLYRKMSTFGIGVTRAYD